MATAIAGLIAAVILAPSHADPIVAIAADDGPAPFVQCLIAHGAHGDVFTLYAPKSVVESCAARIPTLGQLTR